MTPAVGYLAASLVFVTFCTKRMVPLRALAIASNIAFIGYSYLGVLWPILILHTAMLPLNIHRLRQEMSLERPGDILRRLRIVNWRRMQCSLGVSDYTEPSCRELRAARPVSRGKSSARARVIEQSRRSTRVGYVEQPHQVRAGIAAGL